MNTKEINERYSQLAETQCCLSCGSAINFIEIKPGYTCIDLGSGRGTDVIRMAESVGENGFIYGIDAADGMLKKAKRNAEKLGITNVDFIKSELENIPVNDNTADIIISNCTINHAKDKIAVWNEIYRILKPGGVFVVSDIYSLEQVPDEYKNDPLAVAECWAGSVTKNEYMDTLINQGFSDIKVYEESVPYDKGKIKVASFTVSGTKPVDS